MSLRIAGIMEESVVDGPGVRFVLFMQGCRHHCKGCHNPQTWDFDAGQEVSADEVFQRVMANPLVRGVTFSGGDPLEQAYGLMPLAKMLKQAGKDIWCYTGYVYERRKWCPLLEYIDVLVDGPFVQSKKSLTALYRGSTNQRLIDVQASRKANKVVLWHVPQD